MTAYLWIQFVFGVLVFIIRAAFLAKDDYPRRVTYSAAEDVMYGVLGAAFTAWTGYLLFA